MKRYAINIRQQYTNKWIFQTEDELYNKIVWENDYLNWNVGQGIQSKYLIESEFLKAINDVSLLISQFENVNEVIEVK